MKNLIFLLAVAFVGCTKQIPTPDNTLQQAQSYSLNQNTPRNHQVLGNQLRPTPLVDTLGFEVYTCDYDSTHSTMWQTVTIRVASNGDSVVVPCGFDFNHTYQNYALDTTSNYRQTPLQDSNFVRLPILAAGDTIKYYMKGVLTPLPGVVYVHVADFVVTPGYTFKRVYENPMFTPYGLCGDHIYNNSTPFINTINVP